MVRCKEVDLLTLDQPTCPKAGPFGHGGKQILLES